MNRQKTSVFEYTPGVVAYLVLQFLKVMMTGVSYIGLLAYFVTAMVFDIVAGQLTASYYFKEIIAAYANVHGPAGFFISHMDWFASAATTGLATIFWYAVAKKMKGESIMDLLRAVWTVMTTTWYGFVGAIAQVIDSTLFDIPGAPMIQGGSRPGYYIVPGHYGLAYIGVLSFIIMFTVFNDPLSTFALSWLEIKAKEGEAAIKKMTNGAKRGAPKPRRQPHVREASASDANPAMRRAVQNTASHRGSSRRAEIEAMLRQGEYRPPVR